MSLRVAQLNEAALPALLRRDGEIAKVYNPLQGVQLTAITEKLVT